jgi:hypothetical protein
VSATHLSADARAPCSIGRTCGGCADTRVLVSLRKEGLVGLGSFFCFSQRSEDGLSKPCYHADTEYHDWPDTYFLFNPCHLPS